MARRTSGNDEEAATPLDAGIAWGELGVQLTAYVAARRRLDRRFRVIVRSVSAEDVAQEAIKRVLADRRKWSGQGDLLEYLESVTDSILSALWKQQRRKPERPVDLSGDSDDQAALGGRPSGEDEALARDTLDRIEQLIGDDDEALLVFLEMRKGWSRAEVAASLGIDVAAYDKAVKRIRYHVAKSPLAPDWKPSATTGGTHDEPTL